MRNNLQFGMSLKDHVDVGGHFQKQRATEKSRGINNNHIEGVRLRGCFENRRKGLFRRFVFHRQTKSIFQGQLQIREV